jgi:leucyl aminopeptidase (aminopeptidase T)
MLGALKDARRLDVTSDAGTKLRVQLGGGGRWIARLGEIIPGKSVVFPAGALFAFAEHVEGSFVATASVGEFFGAREGVLRASPVRLTIAGGRVTKVDVGGRVELGGNIEAVLRFAENSDRVGLVAIGVNEGLACATGDASVDQNLVGVHLFVGDPAARATGASWSARTSFAVCQEAATLHAGGQLVIDKGVLVEANSGAGS